MYVSIYVCIYVKCTYTSSLGKYFSSDRRTPSASTIGIPAGIKCPPTVRSLSFETRAANGAVILYLKVSSNTCHVYLDVQI